MHSWVEHSVMSSYKATSAPSGSHLQALIHLALSTKTSCFLLGGNSELGPIPAFPVCVAGALDALYTHPTSSQLEVHLEFL